MENQNYTAITRIVLKEISYTQICAKIHMPYKVFELLQLYLYVISSNVTYCK